MNPFYVMYIYMYVDNISKQNHALTNILFEYCSREAEKWINLMWYFFYSLYYESVLDWITDFVNWSVFY